MEQEAGIYNNLGPQRLRGVTDMGSMDQRAALAAQQSQQQQEMVQKQLENWQRSAMPAQGPHASVASAILDGVGSAAKTIGSGLASKQQNDIANTGFAKIADILGKQDQGRFDYGNSRFQSIIDALARRQQGGMGQQPAVGLGLDYGGLDPSLFGG